MERFQVVRELGRGAMGTVLEAEDAQLGRRVALKIVLPGSERRRQRFAVEARALARLQHPHIVRVHEVATLEGRPCLVMELIQGRSLEARLEEDGPLAIREAGEISLHIAQALQAAHDQGLLHRDVKPGNILLTDDGRPLLTDFGLARDTASELDRLTRTGEMLGTPAFMAPEQAIGKQATLDGRTDVYGLGATLYCLLTGETPLTGESMLELLAAIVDSTPAAPSRLRPEIDTPLDTVILKCLEKDPADRYASAEDLAADLERYLAGDPIRARRRSAAAESLRWIARRPALAGMTLLAVAVLSVAAGWTLTYAPTPADKRTPERPHAPPTPVDTPPEPPAGPAAAVSPNRPLLTLAHEGAGGARFMPGRQRAVSWNATGQVKLWNLETGRIIRELSVTPLVERLLPSPSGRRLAYCGSNGFDVLDLERDGALSDGGVPAMPITDLAWSPDEERLVVCGDFDGVRLTKTDDWIPRDQIELGARAYLVAYAPSGSLIAAATKQKGKRYEIHLINAGNRERVGGWRVHYAPSSLAFAPDTSAVYIGDESGSLLSFQLTIPPAPDPLRFVGPQDAGVTWAAHRGRILGIAAVSDRVFSVTGTDLKRLVAKNKWNELRVWDAGSREYLGTYLRTKTARFVDVDIRPDGSRLLLTSTETSQVTLWDTRAFAD